MSKEKRRKACKIKGSGHKKTTSLLRWFLLPGKDSEPFLSVEEYVKIPLG